jgi:alginate O-acetyltransferase complex protein AlgI
MLFNSILFALFLPLLFVLYWYGTNKNFRIQNILLLIASYLFYACWDPRFLFLLIFSTLLDYLAALQITTAKDQHVRKFWFWLSIFANLGFLGVFKYYNFFITSFSEAFSLLGLNFHPLTLNIILPIGISFYTFHGLSYVIDIYNGKIKVERNFINYSLFVSFFPLLVAGPIERATHLLPQIQKERIFNYAKAIDGLKQMLWGFFKKIVIADQCAEYTNDIFKHYNDYSGSTLVLGALFFSIQIYSDFSGYSDIALGTARLFGIELLQNFSFPYFSRNIAEFWRRWHISLTSWFRDYLYIPLGGSKAGTLETVRNVFLIFLVSGFWHGANWTFIAWGFLNALYILPLLIFNTNRNHLDIVAKGKLFPDLKEFFSIVFTFGLTTFAWIFFRAESMEHAFNYISKIFSCSLFTIPSFIMTNWKIEKLFLLIILFITTEWLGRQEHYALENFGANWPKVLRWIFYYSIVIAILYYADSKQQFIYFQF